MAQCFGSDSAVLGVRYAGNLVGRYLNSSQEVHVADAKLVESPESPQNSLSSFDAGQAFACEGCPIGKAACQASIRGLVPV